MQILSAIFPSITWSRFLPSGLIQLIAGIAAIFTVDFSALFTSPECGADSTRRGQWVIRVCIPIFLAFCLLVWAGVARCLIRDKIRQRATLVRIARIAVRLLLLGLYKTAVESSIQILNCENIDGKVSTVVGGGVGSRLNSLFSIFFDANVYHGCLVSLVIHTVYTHVAVTMI